MGKRFVISEDEKKHIIGLYDVKPILNEGKIYSDSLEAYNAAQSEPKYNTCNMMKGKIQLAKGNQGPLVAMIQAELNESNKAFEWGLPPLTLDGVFGEKTKHMVKMYQKSQGLQPVDGIVGYNTYIKFNFATSAEERQRCQRGK